MKKFVPSSGGLYEREGIPDRLRDMMAFRNLSLRMIARSIGISHATVHRILQGGVPDVDSYLLIKLWLAAEAEALITRANALVP